MTLNTHTKSKNNSFMGLVQVEASWSFISRTKLLKTI